MSHIKVKTEYQETGFYNLIEKKTLFAHHNNSSDIVTFFDEKGKIILVVEDTVENNLLDAIIRLYSPYKNKTDLSDKVEHMNDEDKVKCDI